MRARRRYASKIMLAGEYGVILGGEALTIPFPRFFGLIRRSTDLPDQMRDQHASSVHYLRALYVYLSGLDPAAFHAKPDLELFSERLESYWMETNIPVSYGLGSSAVVSAAVYEHFFPGSGGLVLQEQKEDLARIESFFHGLSSGVDALSCYTGRPLHFRGDGDIRPVGLDVTSLPGDFLFFLLDSGAGSHTGSQVSCFMKALEDAAYGDAIRKKYLPLNRELIAGILGHVEKDVSGTMSRLSEFQYRYFGRMIPESMLETWKDGLTSGDYYLKLNGSGGGYLLGMTARANRERLKERWREGVLWIA